MKQVIGHLVISHCVMERKSHNDTMTNNHSLSKFAQQSPLLNNSLRKFSIQSLR